MRGRSFLLLLIIVIILALIGWFLWFQPAEEAAPGAVEEDIVEELDTEVGLGDLDAEFQAIDEDLNQL